MEEFDTPLKKVRKSTGISIAEISRNFKVQGFTGSSDGHLSKVERGIQQASPALAEALSTYFGGKVTEEQILYPERYKDRPIAIEQ